MLAVIRAQTTGINWGQALAIWVPIVTGLFAIAATIIGVARTVLNWQEKQRKQAGEITMKIIDGFAATLNVRFDRIDRHLAKQDEETAKRFSRVDRNTGTDST